MAAADVRYDPDDRRHAQTERECNPDHISGGARATADQNQQQGAHKLGEQRQPEPNRLRVLQAVGRHLRTVRSARVQNKEKQRISIGYITLKQGFPSLFWPDAPPSILVDR